jgi:hypothetical protein
MVNKEVYPFFRGSEESLPSTYTAKVIVMFQNFEREELLAE